ncbi:Holliday junction branch migration protein RuvA [Sandaracinus amylolyticus]|uniref:Holliday junction branch migration protein RuvA n=1 Tax=Sandaracinus amylolyticus TaxID=927083 RepID=UPI00069D885F|nr:Holliday junction branch migration protein RuvA [Sandaracinus amylolyticus]
MIGRLRGQIVDRGVDGTVVLDVAGVGYEVSVPLGALGRLPTPPEAVTLHVHTHVREDAIALFGFATPEDRAAFRTLMTVSSIGPKLALAVLSHLDARGLADAVARQDPSRFKGIPGVGKKIADRLVLELRDKLGFVTAGSSSGSVGAPIAMPIPIPSGPLGQVASALVSMGFKPGEAERAVAAITPGADGKSVDVLLREALSSLG